LRRTTSLAVVLVLVLSPVAASALHATAAAHRRRGTPAPRLRRRPPKLTTQRTAYFTFSDRARGVRFQCALDRGRFKPCRNSARYGPATIRRRCPKAKRHSSRRGRPCKPTVRHVGSLLRVGSHVFRVRAIGRSGHKSRTTVYRWTVFAPTPPPAEAVPFTITTAGAGEPLYPGDAAESIPLMLSNPNSEPLYVTELDVTVSRSPASCEAAENLAIQQSSASSATPVVVPADGSVTLPAQGVTAPTVQMLELPVDQDGCKGATFTFHYSGSGHS